MSSSPKQGQGNRLRDMAGLMFRKQCSCLKQNTLESGPLQIGKEVFAKFQIVIHEVTPITTKFTKFLVAVNTTFSQVNFGRL